MSYDYRLIVRVISDDEVWFYIEEIGNVERCVARKREDGTFYPLDGRGCAILPQGAITLSIAKELEKL
jgi:hypothetical protein